MIDIIQTIVKNDGHILYELWRKGYAVTQQTVYHVILVKYNDICDYLHVIIVKL